MSNRGQNQPTSPVLPKRAPARRTSVLAAALCVALTVLTALPAYAAVHDVRSGLLRASDAPAGFSHPSYKVYTKPLGEMTITMISGGHKGSIGCSIENGATKGLIETFTPSQPGSNLLLCITLYPTATDAHQLYQFATGSYEQAVKHGFRLKLYKPGIGDESIVLGTTVNQLRSYNLTFRHSNALVSLVAFAVSLPYSSVVRLGRIVNSRLH